MKVAIIGFGAIGGALARGLQRTPHEIVAILAREGSANIVRAKAGASTRVVTALEDLLASAPDVVVEAAGHADLIISSIGALADRALETDLRDAAAEGGRLVIPSGAVGGLDALGAALRAGLDDVSYVSRKAPSAWKSTKAETLVDLGSVTEAKVFYEGTARQAALDFPQNANVVAAIALAGIGFDRTRVRLMVDPATTGNRHLLEAHGAFGEISASVLARTLPDNPKTSMLAPYSLVRAIANLADPVVV
jgi:aspartate dehydrogenase